MPLKYELLDQPCILQVVLFSPLLTLAPVVQRADNFIQRISRSAADKMYWLEYILSAR